MTLQHRTVSRAVVRCPRLPPGGIDLRDRIPHQYVSAGRLQNLRDGKWPHILTLYYTHGFAARAGRLFSLYKATMRDDLGNHVALLFRMSTSRAPPTPIFCATVRMTPAHLEHPVFGCTLVVSPPRSCDEYDDPPPNDNPSLTFTFTLLLTRRVRRGVIYAVIHSPSRHHITPLATPDDASSSLAQYPLRPGPLSFATSPPPSQHPHPSKRSPPSTPSACSITPHPTQFPLAVCRLLPHPTSSMPASRTHPQRHTVCDARALVLRLCPSFSVADGALLPPTPPP
ncbi:hypothetical protein B0H13DRAFT_1974425 [Mycena leptocephala]|nr:hypothetical protein B0H13DRAFT_1974425 [Mycena leptocephala]